MWYNLTNFIINNRITLLVGLFISTCFMAWQAKQVQLTYELDKIVPKNQEEYQRYEWVKEQFGEDGNILVIGLQTDRTFEQSFFNAWIQLCDSLKKIEGVQNVLALPEVAFLQKDTTAQKFVFEKLFPQKIDNQPQLDSLHEAFLQLPFYLDRLYRPDNSATFMAVRIEPNLLDSKARVPFMNNLLAITENFAQNQQVDLKYSGLPYLRTFRVTKIKSELILFAIAAMLISALLLFILFRSFTSVLLPALVVLTGVTWMLGLVHLLGYKITLLTGLVPTLLVVIAVPNCVYMINKYHDEYRRLKDKRQALQNTIAKIGTATLYSNLTTAIGFGVFALMKSELLFEFGVISASSIALSYVFSLIIIPIAFYFLPPPSVKETKHLDNPGFRVLLHQLDKWTYRFGNRILLGTLLILLVASAGLWRLQAQGFLFDDIPKNSTEYNDFKFFEDNFGIMPLHIIIDSGKKGGITKLSFLEKANELETVFDGDSLFLNHFHWWRALSLPIRRISMAYPSFISFRAEPNKILFLNTLKTAAICAAEHNSCKRLQTVRNNFCA
ncbi:MAG: MMPL family transporter [Chitinophagales bacterium]